jgi:CBS domain-containing protein
MEIGGIPFVSSDGSLVGIISETDICRVVLACET